MKHGNLGFVAKDYVAELHVAFYLGKQARVRLVNDLDRHGKYLEDALRRHSRSLELRVLLAQVSNRVEETIDVENERYQDPYLQLTLRDHPAAEDYDKPDGHRGHYLDQW